MRTFYSLLLTAFAQNLDANLALNSRLTKNILLREALSSHSSPHSFSLEDLNTESVFDQPDPKVAPRRDHIVVEVIAARMHVDCLDSWLLRAERKETARSLLEEEREVFAAWEWRAYLGNVLRSEPLGGQSLDVLGLSGRVHNGRV